MPTNRTIPEMKIHILFTSLFHSTKGGQNDCKKISLRPTTQTQCAGKCECAHIRKKMYCLRTCTKDVWIPGLCLSSRNTRPTMCLLPIPPIPTQQPGEAKSTSAKTARGALWPNRDSVLSLGWAANWPEGIGKASSSSLLSPLSLSPQGYIVCIAIVIIIIIVIVVIIVVFHRFNISATDKDVVVGILCCAKQWAPLPFWLKSFAMYLTMVWV